MVFKLVFIISLCTLKVIPYLQLDMIHNLMVYYLKNIEYYMYFWYIIAIFSLNQRKTNHFIHLLTFFVKPTHFYDFDKNLSSQSALVSRKSLVTGLQYGKVPYTGTHWKLQNFAATDFSQKFRQINVLLS